MSTGTARLLSIPLLTLALLMGTPLNAGESRYGRWDAGADQLEQLIQELEGIIREGRQARAAHPTFLDDLERTVAKYRAARRTVFLQDDFQDGEFTSQPAWRVLSGQFTVERDGTLATEVAATPPAEAPAPGATSDRGNRTGRDLDLIIGIVEELARAKGAIPSQAPVPAPSATPAEPAAIVTLAAVDNAFTLTCTFASLSQWGAVGLGLFQGSSPESGYRLIYHPATGPERPWQLIKYLRGHPYVVATAEGGGPNLDDGRPHQLTWARGDDGGMVVTVDGQEVLKAHDQSYREAFSGLVIVNEGGSYRFDDLLLYREQ